jgi:hypothetical protein
MEAISSMKQKTIDLQATHTTSKRCAIIVISIDDTKTHLKQAIDSKQNDREDMKGFKQSILNI